MNKFWNMMPSTLDKKVLNIYVYGEIMTNSNWFFGSEDDVVAREFIKDLHNHPDVERINVHINSPGGEVMAAVTMAQQLKKHKAEVHTYVEGIAASAATLLVLAGDVRHMTVSGLFMIHLPSMQFRGNRIAMGQQKEVLDKVEAVIRLTYKNASNLSEEELTTMLEHEAWLTAEEAYSYGFITDVIEDESPVDELIKDIQDDLINFNGTDFKLTAFADETQLRQKLAIIKNKNRGGITMDITAFLNSLPENQRVSVQAMLQQEVQNKVTEQVTALTDTITDLTTQLTTTNTVVTDQSTQIETLTNDLANANATIKTLKDNGEDEDTKFLNSLPVEAKNAIVAARTQAAAAQQALQALNETNAYEAFKNNIAAYDNLPVQEEHIKALFTLSNAAPKEFASIEALFKAANSAAGLGQKAIGSDGGSEASTAYDALNQAVQVKMTKEGMDYNAAFAAVVAENPQLYEEYRNQ